MDHVPIWIKKNNKCFGQNGSCSNLDQKNLTEKSFLPTMEKGKCRTIEDRGNDNDKSISFHSSKDCP